MNLNMQAFNINTLLGGLDKVRDVMGVYQQQLLLIVIVFALLNCFFGYALRKLWSVIPGFFLGAAAGYAAGTYTNQTTTITLALAVGTGLLTAIIAFVLYRIGLFLLICGLVGFCLWHLVNPNDITGYGLVALVAFVIGLICVPFERISVILVTSICGALTTIRMAYFFKDLDLNMMFWIVSAILAAAGMLFQFKPWKEADYWEDDDEEEREHRAKRAPDGNADPVSILFHLERRKETPRLLFLFFRQRKRSVPQLSETVEPYPCFAEHHVRFPFCSGRT